MNRIRKLAQELVTKYPNLFSADFDKNKLALGQVSIIRSTSVRNQLAGAITSFVRENQPETGGESSEEEIAIHSETTAAVEEIREESVKKSAEITQAAQ